MTLEMIPRIRIEAPSAAAAFLLEERMWPLRPNALRDGSHWCVELADDGAGFDEVVTCVRDWLDEIGSGSTTVWFDTARRTVSARRDAEPLGRRRRCRPVTEARRQRCAK